MWCSQKKKRFVKNGKVTWRSKCSIENSIRIHEEKQRTKSRWKDKAWKQQEKNLTVRIIVRFWMKQESKDPKLLLQSRSLFSRLLVLFLAPQAIPICLVKKVTISKPKLVSKFSSSNPLETVKTPKTERWLSKL